MNIITLRENILSALPLSMAKKYEKINRELNNNKEGYYYKKFKSIFDKAFGKDEKGRMIYRKYINVEDKPIDKEIYSFLKQNGYNITEEEFNAGIIIKNKDDKNNRLSLEELQKKGQVLRIGRILNKKKAPKSLLLKWDKISKEISNKKLIVISRHPYDIAGQSTDRAWESCMTLGTDKQNKGDYCKFVDTGIKYGVLIAYLISNDDKNINKPLARVLIKPYTNSDEVQFKVSKVYGVAGNEFRNTVQKWVNKNLNTKHIEVYEDMQKLDLHLDLDNVYDDNDIDVNVLDIINNLERIDTNTYYTYEGIEFTLSNKGKSYIKNIIKEVLDSNNLGYMYNNIIKNISYSFYILNTNINDSFVSLSYDINIQEIDIDDDIKYKIYEEIELYFLDDNFIKNENLYFLSHSSANNSDMYIDIEYMIKPNYILIPNIKDYDIKGGVYKGNLVSIKLLRDNLSDFMKHIGLE